MSELIKAVRDINGYLLNETVFSEISIFTVSTDGFNEILSFRNDKIADSDYLAAEMAALAENYALDGVDLFGREEEETDELVYADYLQFLALYVFEEFRQHRENMRKVFGADYCDNNDIDEAPRFVQSISNYIQKGEFLRNLHITETEEQPCLTTQTSLDV